MILDNHLMGRCWAWRPCLSSHVHDHWSCPTAHCCCFSASLSHRGMSSLPKPFSMKSPECTCLQWIHRRHLIGSSCTKAHGGMWPPLIHWPSSIHISMWWSKTYWHSIVLTVTVVGLCGTPISVTVLCLRFLWNRVEMRSENASDSCMNLEITGVAVMVKHDYCILSTIFPLQC